MVKYRRYNVGIGESRSPLAESKEALTRPLTANGWEQQVNPGASRPSLALFLLLATREGLDAG